MVIICKPVIIYKSCYITVIAAINKDLQLLLHTISIRFSRTLFILTHSYFPNSRTYLSVKVLYFAGPPSCLPNKGHSQSDVQSPGAHLSHLHLDVCQLWILVSTFGSYHGATVKHTLWLVSLFHPWLVSGLASDVRPLSKAPILPQQPCQILIPFNNSKTTL